MTPDFAAHLEHAGCASLARGSVSTLQLNIGRRCNLACHHCHVESGPGRTEAMTRGGILRVLKLLELNPQVGVLDLTGGAPELHPEFRHVVEGARRLERRVIDRCNLTVFFEPGQEDTPEFLARNRVEIIASLPCYTAENVELQRGRGTFDGSIAALKRLNGLGYGDPASGLTLDLVYNPVGNFLPPEQTELESRYREELETLFGIRFNALLTITNMPIKRFAHDLQRTGQAAEYMDLLFGNFNRETVKRLMCRTLISVDHDGRLFDCDFNQALELGIAGPERTIWDVEDLATLEGRKIATGSHCYGCTAGAGSSCGGSLA